MNQTCDSLNLTIGGHTLLNWSYCTPIWVSFVMFVVLVAGYTILFYFRSKDNNDAD